MDFDENGDYEVPEALYQEYLAVEKLYGDMQKRIEKFYNANHPAFKE